MAKFIPVAGGTLPGEPTWINLDNVAAIEIQGNSVLISLSNMSDYLEIKCDDREKAVAILRSIVER